MKKLKAWCEEYQIVIILGGFISIFICFDIGLLMMPKTYRSGIMPVVEGNGSRIDIIDEEMTKRLNLLSEIEEQRAK